MKKLFPVLFVLLLFAFSLNCVSCQKVHYDSAGSEKNMSFDYGHISDPLTMQDVIDIGLRNNLEFHIEKRFKKIQHKNFLLYKLNGLRSDICGTDISDTLNILDLTVSHAVYSNSEKQELPEKLRKRQKHQLALILSESYWKNVAAADHLDFVHAVEEIIMKADREIYPSLEWIKIQLKRNISCLKTELTEHMGLGRNMQYFLARPPVRQIVSAFPQSSEIDPGLLEEYALKHRSELVDIEIPVRRKEVREILQMLFPKIHFLSSAHNQDNRHPVCEWSTAGGELGRCLLNLSSGIPGSDEWENRMTGHRFRCLMASLVNYKNCLLNLIILSCRGINNPKLKKKQNGA